MMSLRYAIPRLGPLAVFCILATAFGYLAESMKPGPTTTDGSLLGVHPSCVNAVAFDPLGRWIASAGRDGSVYLWDSERRELAVSLAQAPGSNATFAYCLAFSHDGTILAAANCDGSVTMWDVATGTHRHTFPDNTGTTRVSCVRVRRSIAGDGMF